MKRIFDFLLALCSLIVLAPLIMILALSVLVALGRPVFFVQERPGYQGRPFNLIKFRSMRDSVDAAGKPRPDTERLTRFGALLRESSLDELPELLNILKGEMSFVGPRPLLMEYLPLYSGEQRRRHEVRPGVTGWAQVNGRNALGWDERFELDVWYVDNQSFCLDLKILFWTIMTVLKRDGISEENQATMTPFKGNQ